MKRLCLFVFVLSMPVFTWAVQHNSLVIKIAPYPTKTYATRTESHVTNTWGTVVDHSLTCEGLGDLNCIWLDQVPPTGGPTFQEIEDGIEEQINAGLHFGSIQLGQLLIEWNGTALSNYTYSFTFEN